MFIKSVKVSGIFDVEGSKEHVFVYKDNKDDSYDSYVNNVRDLSIIQGLLLVFDLKYDSKFDYKRVINRNHKGESIVEITLFNNENREHCHYDWLKKDVLKLKRVLQNPKAIFINKKRYDIDIFHQALISIGFQNINNLCFHKLLDDDIPHLAKFSGDDLWNMLVKVTEHEELIEMIEQKVGVLKRQVMKHSYEYITDAVEREIPKKIELRNTIYESIQMNRNFFTLYYILTERKISVLENQIDHNEEKLDELKSTVDSITLDNHEKKKDYAVTSKKTSSSQNFLKLLHEVKSTLIDVAESYKGETSREFLFDLLSCFASLNAPKSDFKSFADIEIAAVKKCLIDSIAEGTFDETQELLKDMYKDYETYLQFIDQSDENFLFDDVAESILDLDENFLLNIEENFLSEITELSNTLESDSKRSENDLEKIFKYTKDLNLSREDFETLLSIERTVQLSSEAIKSDYLGPVFQFLDTKSGLDVKVWRAIQSTANSFLFKTSKCKNKFLENYLLTYKPHSNCIFYALDECPIKNYDENIHYNEKIISMERLVKNDVDSGQLKSVILSLLHEFLLSNNLDYSWDQIEGIDDYKVVVYDGVASVQWHNGTVTYESAWNNIWELGECGPIEMSQNYYKTIKEYLTKELKISSNINNVEKFHENYAQSSVELINEKIVAINRKASIEGDMTRKIKSDMKTVHNKMKELVVSSPEECQNWDTTLEKDDFSLIINNFYRNYSDQFVDSEITLHLMHTILSEMIVQCENVYGKDSRKQFKSSKHFQNFLNNFEKFKNIIEEKQLSIENLFGSIKVYLEDPEKNLDMMKKFANLYGSKINIRGLIDEFQKVIDMLNDNATYNYKQSIYDEYVNQDLETVFKEISDTYRHIIYQKAINRVDLKSIDFNAYQNLIDSLGKVQEFTKKNLYAPLKVKKRGYPLMNLVVVKVLKDTVHNFTLTYNSVLSDYISYSNLLFYTKSALLNENSDGNFDWNCFDLTRLKSIDFVEKWKSDKKVLPSSIRQLIKALLLILHIINYISIFKFIVISEKMFEGFDPTLTDHLRDFLQNISQFVQIILYKESGNEEEINDQMEVDESENDIIT